MDKKKENLEKSVDKSEIEIGVKQKTMTPCAYGGGDCLVSYYTNDSNGNPIELVYCLKAKQISRTFFGEEKKLRKVGCPEPETNLFGKWKCKYADGKTYQTLNHEKK